MYRFDNPNDQSDRETRIDPAKRPSHGAEVVVDRNPIVADRSQNDAGISRAPVVERRRSERRRIERMGTDI